MRTDANYGPRQRNTVFDVYTLRKRLGLTQTEFAKKLLTTARNVRRLERHGQAPHSRLLDRMRELDKTYSPPTPTPVQRDARPSAAQTFSNVLGSF